MQLLFAIVQSEDADQVCRLLNEADFRVTRINSTGGFLVRGNVTLLLGVEDARVNDVMRIIRSTCRARRSFINALPWGPETVPMAGAPAMPLEVQIGGATVFGVPVKRFLRMQGGAAPPAADEKFSIPDADPANGGMDLVLAIVQSDDAVSVKQALVAAGHRLTQITSAGTFLRRNNVTLAIGVARRARRRCPGLDPGQLQAQARGRRRQRGHAHVQTRRCSSCRPAASSIPEEPPGG